MTVITDQEITDMRAIADNFFPDVCTIQVRTETADALGGVSVSYANTYTGVACRLDPQIIGATEGIENMTTEAESWWMLNIPYDQAISVEDRVVHDGKTYEVQQAMDTNSYRTIRRARLIRVD